MSTEQAHPQTQSFGALLKRYRVAAGLTQEALAEQARLSVRAISDLERGVNQTPRHDTVRLLATALSLSAQERAAFAAAARPTDDAASPPPSLDQRAPHLPGAAQPQRAGGPAAEAVPLVGRVRELALLERHLTGTPIPPQGPPVLLLAGEPGIGKSRLLREADRRAAARGWQVLADGCQRRGGEPYAPLLGALQRYFAAQAPIHLRADLAGCAWLVRLLPELADGPIEPLPAGTLPPEQERRLMVAALERFLGNVAGRGAHGVGRGTLLLLDDLQWASPDALDLLVSVVRSAGPAPLRVVGAYRDTEVGPDDPLASVLADLAHAGLATQHTLAPLAPEEAARLLDDLLEEGDAEERAALRERVVQRAGRVPFFLVSCARALQAGQAEERRAETLTLPWDVAQSVRQRLAALSAPTREMLGVAAVMGRVVPRALLVVAAARPVEELLEALEAACRARLLEEQSADGYQFAHDVIREVVESDLGAARRALLHGRIGAALEQEPGVPAVEALAYHFARSDDRAKAALYLEQSGDRAQAQYAHTAAERSYRAAVERLDGLGCGSEAACVREKLGVTLRTLARYDEALAVLEQAAQTYRATGDLESLARAATQIGWIHTDRSTADEGLAYLQPVLATLEAHGSAYALAKLHAALAGLFYFGGRYDEGLAAAERAAHLAHAAGDDGAQADAEVATVYRGLTLWEAERMPEALRAFEEAIVLAEAAGNLHYLCYALNLAGSFYLECGEFEQRRIYTNRAFAVAERQGDPAQIALMTTERGLYAFLTGDWPRARREYERALTLSRQIDSSAHWGVVYTLHNLGRLCLAEGAWDEASRYLDEGQTLAGAVGAHMDIQSALAERDLLAGRLEAARERLAPLVKLREGREVDALPYLAWAYLELGQVAQAEEVATQAVTRARAVQHRVRLVDALRVQGMVLARQERWAEAERSLEEGVALARTMPYPYAEARLLHVYGEMHLHKAEPEPARERLVAALALFQRLGARKDAERVAQAIQAIVDLSPTA